MNKKTHTFDAISTSGRIYTLHVYVDQIDLSGFGAPGATLPGGATLKTSEGQTCNYVEKGRYQIVMTGEILRSADPLAP